MRSSAGPMLHGARSALYRAGQHSGSSNDLWLGAMTYLPSCTSNSEGPRFVTPPHQCPLCSQTHFAISNVSLCSLINPDSWPLRGPIHLHQEAEWWQWCSSQWATLLSRADGQDDARAIEAV